ncbi:hypothetical protein ES703_61710 [subsurface metagenome]
MRRNRGNTSGKVDLATRKGRFVSGSCHSLHCSVRYFSFLAFHFYFFPNRLITESGITFFTLISPFFNDRVINLPPVGQL